jgi:hypothetical protein
MRPLKSLSLESFVEMLRGAFRQIPDERDPQRITWKLPDVALSAFAMFFFQHPSLLEYQRRMKKKHGHANLETIFGVTDLPSDAQMRTLLDGATVEPLRDVLTETFERMRRVEWTTKFVTEVNGERYYTAVLDGSQYFSSPKIHCPSCLHWDDKNGDAHYSHVVVGATLVRAGSHDILPLDAEDVSNKDGQEKQDCEINAAKRLVVRLRARHRQLKLCIGGDDLYSHEPFVLELRALRLGFVLVAKPSSHKELFEWVEELDRLGECLKGSWEEGPAGQRRYFKYRIAAQVPLTQTGKVLVNFVEVWEHNKAGELVYHNSWVTDFEITHENATTIIGIGRSRWKIENEQFNVQKNHGYELEHNYGHGHQNLALVFYLLNLLAFLAHKVLELGDRLYQQCRVGESRRGLWGMLRAAFYLFTFASWDALLLNQLSDEARGP